MQRFFFFLSSYFLFHSFALIFSLFGSWKLHRRYLTLFTILGFECHDDVIEHSRWHFSFSRSYCFFYDEIRQQIDSSMVTGFCMTIVSVPDSKWKLIQNRNHTEIFVYCFFFLLVGGVVVCESDIIERPTNKPKKTKLKRKKHTH